MGAFLGKTETEELTSKVSGVTLTLVRKGDKRQLLLGGKLMVTMSDNAKNLYTLAEKDRPSYTVSNSILYQHMSANSMSRLSIDEAGSVDVIVWMNAAPASAQNITGSVTWFTDGED